MCRSSWPIASNCAKVSASDPATASRPGIGGTQPGCTACPCNKPENALKTPTSPAAVCTTSTPYILPSRPWASPPIANRTISPRATASARADRGKVSTAPVVGHRPL